MVSLYSVLRPGTVMSLEQRLIRTSHYCTVVRLQILGIWHV